MKNLKFIVILFLVFISCSENEEIEIIESNLLLGNWSEVVYDNEKLIFKRVKELPQEAYGFSFKEEFPEFLERTSGFCGTPPLSFFDIKGSWQIEDGHILKIYDLNITNQYRPDNGLLYNFKIVSLTKDVLILKRELTEQEKDQQELMDLYNEFYEMANNKSCTDENNWSFVGYGSKACGGFQGYIAYSTLIDVTAFLQKVEKYTQLEDEYNRKWGIYSTCDLVAQPQKVICLNGQPTLKY
ncbi:hypothetical protein ACSIGC_11025 [Tenacibaculum sp. ZS6-P6]|uniref:hypothetical protein n=1 Tax=Tenacibaculum sp. ZS6-P6 TaxID=3447503 RepID=UPI003F95D6DE